MGVVVGLMPGPANAEPDIDDVQQRVDRLYRQAEKAGERYHDAKLDLRGLRRDLAALRSDERHQERRVGRTRSQVEDSVVSQYQGDGLATMGEVVVSDNPSDFLSELSTVSSYNDVQGDLYDDYSTDLKALRLRRGETSDRAAEVADLKASLAQDKRTVDRKYDKASALLDRLKADEREALLAAASTGEPVPAPSSVRASGRASAAVNFALAQVGDAYVWGAAGPDAYDCSGLTMAAWSQAGVGLPHSSSAQSGSGMHVAASDLQPGDLVFYYSPISHVGMYIGNGMIVHAANPGAGVRVDALYSMPFSGAVRPG